jgi:hypothetical protein
MKLTLQRTSVMDREASKYLARIQNLENPK